MSTMPSPTTALQPHLQPGERLLWHIQPGATPLSGSERNRSIGFALFAAAIGTTLASLADTPGSWLPAVFIAITAVVTLWRRRTDRLPVTRIYAVTNHRALILESGRMRAFAADDITYLDVQTLDDGSIDLVWGSDRGTASSSTHQNQGWTGRANFVSDQRHFKRGFLGLRSAEPARTHLENLRKAQRDAVTAAVPDRPLQDVATPASRAAEVEAGWQTVRQPELGFAINLPTGWPCRTARIRRYRLLGLIPFELEPRWSSTPQPGWNRLTVDTGAASVALQVSLNPEGFPDNLDAVINDRWARILNLTLVEALPDVTIGTLRGFSALHNLEGAGPKIGLGPVTVSAGEIKQKLLQRQMWLRGEGLAVHLHYVVPAGDPGLHAAVERVVGTARIEGARRA